MYGLPLRVLSACSACSASNTARIEEPNRLCNWTVNAFNCDRNFFKSRSKVPSEFWQQCKSKCKNKFWIYNLWTLVYCMINFVLDEINSSDKKMCVWYKQKLNMCPVQANVNVPNLYWKLIRILQLVETTPKLICNPAQRRKHKVAQLFFIQPRGRHETRLFQSNAQDQSSQPIYLMQTDVILIAATSVILTRHFFFTGLFLISLLLFFLFMCLILFGKRRWIW